MADDLGYLGRLTLRLAEGLERLPPEVRARHAAYLRAAQQPDGGFPGREGGSDLYYTGFALRALFVLAELTPEIATPAGAFLSSCLTRPATVIDFHSLLYSCLLVQLGGGPDVLAAAPADWPDRVAATLDGMRSADGGFARSPGGSGSTYHSFLVALSYQLLGRDVPRADDLARFVASRWRDGGFVEIAAMRRAGTNPTAAAVALLQMLPEGREVLTPDVSRSVVAFLAGMASSEGGLRANGRIPLADLLSTFTGAWTLDQLDALDHLDRDALRRYAEGCERPEGGFRGGLWDAGHDAEYTFYGLGVLALLSRLDTSVGPGSSRPDTPVGLP